MAKQKRLNKNVVAFLTLMGVVLAVSVAALVIRQGARRDPEVLARQARDIEQLNDIQKLPEARRLYGLAYVESDQQDTVYVLDVARCLFKEGLLPDWNDALQKTIAKFPQDRTVMRAALTGLWRLREIQGTTIWPAEWRDWSDRLLDCTGSSDPNCDPNDPFGLACRAFAGWSQRDEAARMQADAAAAAAYALAPHDSHTALAYLELRRRQFNEELRQAAEQGTSERELAERRKRFEDELVDILAQAVAANPTAGRLAITYCEYLSELGRARVAQGDAAGRELLSRAAAQLGESLERVQHALDEVRQKLADTSSLQEARAHWDQLFALEWYLPELHLAFAQQTFLNLLNTYEDLPEEEQRAALAGIAQHVDRALELDPALYEAYASRAQLRLMTLGDAAAGPAEFEAALSAFEEAAQATRILQSLRVRLTEHQRWLMLARGVEFGLEYARLHAGEKRPEVMSRAKALYDEIYVKVPNIALTPYLRGLIAVAEGDELTALQSFERANEMEPRAAWWSQAARVSRPPVEFLARLYLETGQLGEAQRCAEEALRQYQSELGRMPPPGLVRVLSNLYVQLDKAPQARQLLEQALRSYPDHPELSADLALVLAQAGETDAARKAQRVLKPPQTAGEHLVAARLALTAGDFDAVATAARAVLDAPEASDTELQAALQMLVGALQRLERQDEARELVKKLAADPPRPSLRNLLASWDIVLSETDPQARDQKLLAHIGGLTDPVARAEQYYGFYMAGNDLEQALGALAELQRLRPEDLNGAAVEFNLRLRLAEERTLAAQQADAAAADTARRAAADHLEQAERLAKRLGDADAGQGLDRVGGATFRAQLALARGDAELALREYRQAAQNAPKSAELQVGLARAYLAAGRAAEAVDALKKATAFNPRSVDAYGLLISAYDTLARKAKGAERVEFERAGGEALQAMEKLAPAHPFVAQRRQRREEEANPRAALAAREKRRAAAPTERENLGRLAELYPRALVAALDANDAPAIAELRAQGTAFFTSAYEQAPDVRLPLAEAAIDFFALAGARESGEAFFLERGAAAEGEDRVLLQLMHARFLERVNAVEGAERSYAAAQGLVPEVVTDPQRRRLVELQLGMQFIDFYQRTGRPNRVVEVCRWMLDRVAEPPEAVRRVRLRLVDALLQSGAAEDAEKEIEDLARAHGEQPEVLMSRARVRLARGQHQGAAADLSTILQGEPDNVWALLARGWLSLQRARYDEARTDLVKARSLTVVTSDWAPRLHQLLAALYERQQQTDLAVSELRHQLEALSRSRGGAQAAQTQQVVSNIVQLLRRNNQTEQARQLVSEYMQKHLDEPIWPFQLAELLEERADAARRRDRVADAEKDYAAAAEYYHRTVEAARERDTFLWARACAGRIGVLQKAGKSDAALDYFNTLPQDRLPPALRIAGARVYWARNQQDEAVTQWQKALLDASVNSIQLVSSVVGEIRKDLPAEALERLLQEIVGGIPADAEPALRLRIGLAENRLREHKYPEALATLDETMAVLAPNTLEYLAALLTRGQVYEQTKDVVQAIDTYQRVLAVYPDHLAALNNLAYLLATAEGPGLPRLEEALKYAERLEALVQENPNAANMLDTIGWVFFRYAAGRPEQRDYVERALGALEQSVMLNNVANFPAFEHLGRVYAAQGRRADARQWFSRGQAAAEQILRDDASAKAPDRLAEADRQKIQEQRELFEQALSELQ